MCLFKKKIYKLNEKEYGYLLSKMILTSTQSGFSEISNNFDTSEDKLMYFLELSLHYAFICECLLKEKYSSLKVDRCINYAIEGLVLGIGISDDATDQLTENIFELYNCIKDEKIDIFTEEGLHQLAQSYQDCCDLGKDLLIHATIFLLLSGFIIHHTSDIAGKHLVLI